MLGGEEKTLILLLIMYETVKAVLRRGSLISLTS